MANQAVETRGAALPQPEELEALVRLVLDEAKACGATGAEAGISLEAGLSVTVRLDDGRTTVVNQNDLGGIREGSYVRVYDGRAWAR